MPPRLLPKSTVERATPESEEDIVESVGKEAEARPMPRSRDPRNFEFVNATGSTVPNAISLPSIRSHVMREANRLTYSATAGQSAGSSLATGPQVQERSQPQVQKFRISSAGFHPMLPSKRLRRGQSRSGRSSPSRVVEEVEESNQPAEAQRALDDEYNQPNDMRSAVGQDGSQSGFPRFGSNVGHDSLRTANYGTTIPAYSADHRSASTNLHLSAIGGEEMDPFHSLPIPHSQRTNFLLHHYQARLIDSVPLMTAVRKLWFAKAMGDTAFLFIKLCYAAGSLSLIEGDDASVESLMLKNEAIKVINERLEHSSTRINEGTLSAVASIVSYEATNGSPESIRLHADGLRQMIKVRGGMRNSCPGLKRLVAWADLQSANALLTRPVLPPIDVLLGETSPEDGMDHSASIRNLRDRLHTWDQEHQWLLPHFPGLNDRVLEMIAILRCLSSFTTLGAESDQLWLSDAIYIVQRDFMLASYEFQNAPGIEQFYCIIGLIYVECFLRRVNLNAKILQTLHGRLQASVAKVEEAFHFKPDDSGSRFVLWALFIGAVSSNQNDWYVAKLESSIRPAAGASWEEMESILGDIVFPETFLLGAKQVWEVLIGNWQLGSERHGERY